MNVRTLAADGDPAWEIAGLGVGERTRRALARAEVHAAPGKATLVLAADALLEPEAVRALLDVQPDDAVAVPAGDAGAPAALRAPAGAAVPEDADGLADLLARFRAEGRVREVDLGGARCERVRTPEDAARIERALLDGLIQPTDGFFARHFDRRLSIPLSVALVRRGVAPNAITAVATAVGLLGAVLLASTAQAVQVLGGLLFVVSTILDGSDGEVARLSLRRSELGRILDLTGDNVVNVAVFAAIGWSALAEDPGTALRVAVAATLFGVCAASAAGFWYAAWLDRSGHSESPLHRYESLFSRDWAYLVLALALFDRLPWLLWGAAVGSNVAAAGLVVLRLRRWPPPPAPARGAAADPARREPGEWA